jgi:hypothetical protein
MTAVYDYEWYLGYVIEKEQNLKEAKVTFLEPKGPSRSLNYPTQVDILTVSFVDILTSAEVLISNEKFYNIIQEEQVKASKMLKMRHKSETLGIVSD